MIDLGDTVRLTARVVDAAGTLTDPGTATLTVTLPDGTTDEPAVILPPATTGIVQVDYETVQYGLHRWRLVTTDPEFAHTDSFNVADPSWPSLVGLAEVKAHLNIPAGDTRQDDELRGFILSASAVVEDVIGAAAQRTIVETNSGGERHVILTHSPVREVTQVTEDDQVVDSGDYEVSPYGLVRHKTRRWNSGLHNIEVTYVAGRAVVPGNILDATKELIRINWRPQQGGNYNAFDGGANDDFGGASLEASLQGNLRLGFFIPNTVTQRLQPNKRGPVVL